MLVSPPRHVVLKSVDMRYVLTIGIFNAIIPSFFAGFAVPSAKLPYDFVNTVFKAFLQGEVSQSRKIMIK